MKFYDETKLLYINVDASRFGLGVALIQTRSSTNCSGFEAPDNSILKPTTFVNKSMSSIEKRIQQYRKKSTRYTIWI